MSWCKKCNRSYGEDYAICPICKTTLEMESDFEDSQMITEDDLKSTGYVPAYVNPEDRYENEKSSAQSFLVIGCLGLIMILLVLIKIIPFPVSGTQQYFMLAVMAALFLIFLFFGLKSHVAARKLYTKIDEENALSKEIISWFLKTADQELIEIDIDSQTPEEIKYYKRSAKIKKFISSTYTDLTPSHLEKLTEDIYTTLYESK